MNLIIKLNDIRVHAPVGVYDFEKIKGNDFEISVTVCFELPEASLVDDNVNKTVNYAHIAEIVADEMMQPCNLIESAALRIARAVKSETRKKLLDTVKIESVQITVKKLSPPIDGIVMHSASATVTV